MSEIKQNLTKKANPMLRDRLEKLPHAKFVLVNNYMKEQHARTYYRFLSGTSKNLQVALSLSSFLGCTVNDLLNPSFDFDPENIISLEQQELIAKLKLKKG